MRTIKRAGIAGVIASAMALAGSALPAQAATPAWHQVESQHFGPAKGYSGYTTEAAFAANNVWAFGGSDLGGTGTDGFPVAVHWNGHGWATAKMPSGVTSVIGAVSAPAPNDIWAVTEYDGWILHYNGATWAVSKHLPSTGHGLPLEFTSVEAFGTSNVWAFGGSGADPGIGTWHYDGHTWRQETTVAAGAGISFAVAFSASNMWASGSSNVAPDAQLEHYNGHSWSVVSNSALTGLQFNGLAALSASSLWALAAKPGATSSPASLLHHGTHWSKVALPAGLQPVGSLSSDGHGGLWTVVLASTASATHWYALHWAPGNKWTKYAVPGGGTPVLIPRTTTALLGGLQAEKTGANAALWAYGTI